MRSFRGAIRELAQAQKARRGVSLYSRFINRPLGRVLAAICYKCGLTPNLVTLLSAVATATGLTALATSNPTPTRAILVSMFLIFGFALDSADGQLARLQDKSSASGEWLDHVVDAGKIVAVHAAILITIYRYIPVIEFYYLVPLTFQLVATVTFTGGTLVELLSRIHARPGRPLPSRPTSRLRAFALLPADYGILALCVALIGWPSIFLWAYALLSFANLLIMAALLYKWLGKLTRLVSEDTLGA